jgi:hypothetical protein
MQQQQQQQQRRRRPHSSRYATAFELEEPPWRCKPRWPVLTVASLGGRDVTRSSPLSISLDHWSFLYWNPVLP